MIGKIVTITLYHIKALCNTLLWVFLQFLHEDFKNYIPLKRKCTKMRILANGPSMKDVNLDNILKDTDICVVNDFCKSHLFKKIKPNVYVLADPLYFYDEIMRDTELETIKKLQKVDWQMFLFVPYSVYKIALKKIHNSYIRIFPYHANSYKGWECFKFYFYKKGLSMPLPQNVLIPSIFCSINMGYQFIEIYGVDHSWTKDIRVNDKNQVCLTDYHFYDQQEAMLKPWRKCNGEQYKMHEILRDLAFMFEGYHLLRKYADKNNCVIRNMTSNSFIDAFKRGIELDKE